MKKSLSIFFLSIFFLFQYGKMLAYMECRVVAAIESKVDCGCDDKLTTDSNQQPSSSPLHQHHLKNYTEEFFDHHWMAKDLTIKKNIPSTETALQQDQLPGFLHGILQPPRI